MTLTIQQNEEVVKLHKALREFGYVMDIAYVRESMERLLDRPYQPRTLPEGFMLGWLEQAGLR